MALEITKLGILDLLQFLKQFEPSSTVISGAVASVAKGDPHGMQVWANKEYEPNVVVVSADQSKCKNSYCQKLVFVFSTDNNKKDLRAVLHSPGVINFKSEIHFRDILKPTFEAIKTVISAEDRHVISMTGDLNLISCDTSSNIPNISLPHGFYFGEITPDVADKAANLWVQKGPDISGLFYDLYRWGYMSIVVYHSATHEPVAWIMQNFYDSMLHLHVERELRRSGIGLRVLSEYCRRSLAKEGRVFGLIEVENKAMAEMSSLIGFRRAEGLEFVYQKIDLTLEKKSYPTLSSGC